MNPVQNMFVKYRVINGTAYLALQNDLYELDEVGLTIWNHMDGTNTVEMISGLVADKYQADRAQVSEDTEQFIQDLIKNNLAEV